MARKFIKTFNPHNVYVPKFLANEELMQLMLEATDGFIFIVNCHCGKITFTSETILNILRCTRKDWIGASIFDKIHVDDIENVKLQLSIKLPYKAFCFSETTAGFWKKEEGTDCLKRDFICRMKLGTYDSKKRKRDSCLILPHETPQFIMIRCRGFIKKEEQNDNFYYSSNLYSQKDDMTSAYLVVTGRIELYSLPLSISTISMKLEFTTRLNPNGVYIFVDERIRHMLPYVPRDLIGKNFQNFCHILDRPLMCECFKQSLNFKGQHMTVLCRFKSKRNEWVFARATMYGFINFWSSADEFIVCTYSLVNQPTQSDYYFPTILQDNRISTTDGQNTLTQLPGIDYNQPINEFESNKLFVTQGQYSDVGPMYPCPVNFPFNAKVENNTQPITTIDLNNPVTNWSWNAPLEETVEEDFKIFDSATTYLKTDIENNSQELTDILSVLKEENSSVFENVFNGANTAIQDKDLTDIHGSYNNN